MNTTEQELAFEKELSRLRKLRDNAGKNIKEHREKVAFHKARLATEEWDLENSRKAYFELQERLSELWKEHDGE